MLIVRIHNDGTGTPETANYDIDVSVTLTPTELKSLARFRIENWERGRGWAALVHEVGGRVCKCTG